jgi:hypothetical protein
MDNIEVIKEYLDKQLTPANLNVGIAFGENLFLESKARGW